MLRIALIAGAGSARSAVGPAFTLGNPTPSVSATFSEHILAGRIALQAPPCTPGFGVCDADFNRLFFEFGLTPFTLHAATASGPWHLDPGPARHPLTARPEAEPG